MFDFPETVEDLNTIPADFRPLYAQGDNGVSINPDLKSTVDAFRNINKALTKSRTEADGYKKQVVDLSPLAEYGDSPETIQQAFQTKMDEILSTSGKAKIDIEKIKADMAKATATEREKLERRNVALTQQLYTLNVRNEGIAAISAAGAAERAQLIMPFIERSVQQVEEEGKLNTYVVDQDSNRRFSSITGEPMTIRDLVDEMRNSDQYAPLFPSQTRSGGGTTQNRQNGTSTNVRQKAEDMNPTQKIAAGLALKHGRS